jgi:hypothetical protein
LSWTQKLSKFISASRSFGFAQDRLHQVAAPTAPQHPQFARAILCACNTWTCLSPSADEIRDWGNSVTQFMIDYLGGLRDRPAYRHTSSREIRSGLDSKLPIKETDFDALLKVFRETIVPV